MLNWRLCYVRDFIREWMHRIHFSFQLVLRYLRNLIDFFCYMEEHISFGQALFCYYKNMELHPGWRAAKRFTEIVDPFWYLTPLQGKWRFVLNTILKRCRHYRFEQTWRVFSDLWMTRLESSIRKRIYLNDWNIWKSSTLCYHCFVQSVGF